MLKNNNQCFEKIEDYFLAEIENTYTIYKRMRMSLFLIGDMQKKRAKLNFKYILTILAAVLAFLPIM